MIMANRGRIMNQRVLSLKHKAQLMTQTLILTCMRWTCHMSKGFLFFLNQFKEKIETLKKRIPPPAKEKL